MNLSSDTSSGEKHARLPHFEFPPSTYDQSWLYQRGWRPDLYGSTVSGVPLPLREDAARLSEVADIQQRATQYEAEVQRLQAENRRLRHSIFYLRLGADGGEFHFDFMDMSDN